MSPFLAREDGPSDPLRKVRLPRCSTVPDVRDETQSEGLRGWQVGAALLAMSVLIACARLHTLHEPLDPDLQTYAAMGHEIVSGKRLYTDVWDVKPPGLYVTYAVGELVAGYGDREVWFLGTMSALATLLGVYAAGAALGRKAGLVAAAFWTALNAVLVIQANQPNSEVFINAATIAGFALLVRHPGERRAWARALAIGALLAIGSTYKPVVVFLAFFLAVAHVLAPPRSLSRTDALVEVGLMGVAAAVVWGLIFGYAAVTGQTEIYWATNVTLNRHRGGGILFNLYRYLREGKIVPPGLLFLLPLVAFVIAGAFVGLRRGPRRVWIFFLALQAGVHVMIFSQGTAFHPHSYQMWLPTLAVGAGWAMATLAADPRLREGAPWKRHLGAVSAALTLVLVLGHEVPNYFQPAEEWARRKYGNDVIEDPPFARAVAGLLRPSETLFEYGDGAVFYYYGHLRPTTPTLWFSHNLALTSVGRRLSEMTLARLEDAPPDLFIVHATEVRAPAPVPASSPGLALRLLAGGLETDAHVAWDKHPVYEWAMSNYRPWPQDDHLAVKSARYEVFVRQGSDLERRLFTN
jgi:4-amino-4-deoxy-L-arabinose transferase-like glycosyltransferase